MTSAINILRTERANKAAELDALQSKLRELRAIIRSIDDAIGILGGENRNDGAKNPTAYYPPLKIIVKNLLEEMPALSPSVIQSEIKKLGRETDINTILGTLSRARKERLVHKKGRVWFSGPDDADNSFSNEKVKAPELSEAFEEIEDSAVGAVGYPPIPPTTILINTHRDSNEKNVPEGEVQPNPPFLKR